MESYTVHLLDQESNQKFKHPSNYVETTKYSYITFIPKSIFFQFLRLANFYFLCTAILQSIPGISPISPLTAIAPLVFVLLVAMVKEALEDIARRKNDKLVNHSKCLKWKNGWVKEEWRNLYPGDMVKIADKEEFPADLILLKSSEVSGECKVQTSNLDGEINLKTKYALKATMDLFDGEILKSTFVDVKVEANMPCYGLSAFSGNIYAGTENWVDYRQLLLRGSNLKNTAFVIGMVVYSGHNTKILMNQKSTPFKRSSFESILNKIVIFQLTIQTGLCLFLAISSVAFETDEKHDIFTYNPDGSPWAIGSSAYFAFFLLLNSLIPISMIVSLELIRYIQTFFLQLDNKMYCTDKKTGAKVQNLSILDDLGAIDYIFCDKTGTLTANIMEFKGCNIAGTQYIASITHDSLYLKQEHNETKRSIMNHHEDQSVINEIIGDLTSINSESFSFLIGPKLFKTQKDFIEEFLLALVLCNDIVTDKSEPQLKYLSSSPDEIALIKATAALGFEFIERSHSGITVKVHNEEKFFEILAVNGFTSERKRMSVLVKNPDDNSIRLYIKGADEAILKLLDYSNEVPYFDGINAAVLSFAEQGLRTLHVGFKYVDDCEEWLERYKEVKSRLTPDQEEKLKLLAETIEQDICILGVTAVEDRLQHNVPKAILEFTQAKIKVWMITGDKLETAENIAHSCSLLNKHWTIFHIRAGDDVGKQLQGIYDEIQSRNRVKAKTDMGLIIEGDCLSEAIEKHRKILYKLCKKAKGVVCCRANPKQKAKVVNFIRKMDPRAKTLAVGDGGNDISMIQCAHVGIGIYGNEGHQAADSSDFAIAQFRFLRQLLFVHGRWNSRRIGYFILYFFFKNLTFTLVQAYFAFNSGFSGQTVWDDWYLLLFNSVITAAGIFCYSLLDQDLNSRLDPDVKKFWPQLYEGNRENLPLTLKKYLFFMLWGIFCSVAVYLICTNAFLGIVSQYGHTEVFWDLSTCMYSAIIVTVNIVLIIKMKYWTWIQHVTIWGLSFVLYCPAFMLVYDLVPGSYVYANTKDFLGEPVFWAAAWLCVGVCTVPYYFIVLYFELFNSTVADMVYQKRYVINETRESDLSAKEKIEANCSTNHTRKFQSSTSNARSGFSSGVGK